MPNSLRDSLGLCKLTLQSKGLAQNTIGRYLFSARQLIDYLEANQLPTEPAKVQRKYVEAYIIDQLHKNSETTAATRFRSVQQFRVASV